MDKTALKLRIIELMPDAPLAAWKAAYRFVTSDEELPVTKEEMESQAITDAIARHAGNKRAAAQELGISERTIYRKTRK